MALPIPTTSAKSGSEPGTQEMTDCPNCKAEVMVGAGFCGNCGFNLRADHLAPLPPVESIAPASIPPLPPVATPPEVVLEPIAETKPPEPSFTSAQNKTQNKTQLQQVAAYLFHVQTESRIEIPPNLSIVHIGKPNNLIPPDIDLSGFPDSDIVSRVHGDIRNEGDAYYFEDTGSSNGTYINNVPLPPGNRHRLRAGDRIAMGKGDKVSFIFQTTS
jgi:pSer/pThr/pTyr-binding forkhead associated (FHA) protein